MIKKKYRKDLICLEEGEGEVRLFRHVTLATCGFGNGTGQVKGNR
jgi:hypothetical protein